MSIVLSVLHWMHIDIDESNLDQGICNQDECLLTESHRELTATNKRVSFADEVAVHNTAGDALRLDDVGCALRDTARRGSLAVKAAGGYDVIAAALGNEVTAIPDVVDSLADNEPSQTATTSTDEGDKLDDLDDGELDKVNDGGGTASSIVIAVIFSSCCQRKR